MYYVYVLRSKKDKHFYVGYSSDLKQRVTEHFQGESFATKARLPLELVYYEAYVHKHDATTRERFLKTGWGRNYLKRVLQNYLQEQ
jgi:putative endonuclease